MCACRSSALALCVKLALVAFCKPLLDLGRARRTILPKEGKKVWPYATSAHQNRGRPRYNDISWFLAAYVYWIWSVAQACWLEYDFNRGEETSGPHNASFGVPPLPPSELSLLLQSSPPRFGRYGWA